MIVVSDTSCISNLLTIREPDLLRKLFGDIIVPPAVEMELRRFHGEIPSMFVVRPASNRTLLERLSSELHRGEAEAICLAIELKAERLLIDEKVGREVAKREGVAIIGMVGVLIAAKEKQLIPAVAPLLDQLQHEAGFRLSAAVRKAALEAVGEHAV
jgi:uncharacterized protein